MFLVERSLLSIMDPIPLEFSQPGTSNETSQSDSLSGDEIEDEELPVVEDDAIFEET